jgi:hypothetical protein
LVVFGPAKGEAWQIRVFENQANTGYSDKPNTVLVKRSLSVTNHRLHGQASMLWNLSKTAEVELYGKPRNSATR